MLSEVRGASRPAHDGPAGERSPRWRTVAIGIVVVASLAAAAGSILYLVQPTTLTVAVAPRDGPEARLVEAFAGLLADGRRHVRLRVLASDDLHDSAAALQDGRADLAVVRPDVAMPTNGLTVAMLGDQALLVVAPASAGIPSFGKLSGRRLGVVARGDADASLVAGVLAHHGLAPEATGPRTSPVARGAVRLVPVDGAGVAAALRSGAVDAVAGVAPPSSPRAVALVDGVRAASRDRRAAILPVDDAAAMVERDPMLQAVTVQAGLYGGRPKLPEDDVATVGGSYRLVARDTLNRTVTADLTELLFETRTKLGREAEATARLSAPAYDSTVAATSARLPNHPGAIDYYEREQRGFIERYGDAIYLLAFLGSAVGSVLAWLRRRVVERRHRRMDGITGRLMAIAARARDDARPDLNGMSRDIDSLSAEAIACARDDASGAAVSAVAIAVAAARDAVGKREAVASVEREHPG